MDLLKKIGDFLFRPNYNKFYESFKQLPFYVSLFNTFYMCYLAYQDAYDTSTTRGLFPYLLGNERYEDISNYYFNSSNMITDIVLYIPAIFLVFVATRLIVAMVISPVVIRTDAVLGKKKEEKET